MKVVLFCGGRGFRLPGQIDAVPKPMTQIGCRPILWHLMRYYAEFGFVDFVLCLGFRGEIIKNYFLDYNEALSNDFILDGSTSSVELLGSDIQDWNISFLDTGLEADVGQRLRAARPVIGDSGIFCVNYGDNLTDAPLDEMLERFAATGKIGAMLSVRPNYSFHLVAQQPDGIVTSMDDLVSADIWMNGGYFLFRPEVFDYLGEGEDLVGPPLERLVRDGQLMAYRHHGFWSALDTLKDWQELQVLHDTGAPPWRRRRPAPA